MPESAPSNSRFPASNVSLQYVLVTPARNEESFIEQTIKSVVAQKSRPLKWVIVSDGSTDRTDDIVKQYAVKHEWIQLVRTPERTERHFAGKVHAFNAGYAVVKDQPYDIIGSLDADITFDETYFEFLLGEFAKNPRLGVAGTPFRENNFQYNYKYVSQEHVSGACQLFRRECFKSIGGYTPLKGGGIDLVAVVTARLRGWETKTFVEKICNHHRPLGTAKHHPLKQTFRDGYFDYPLGVHPLYKTISSIYRMGKSPIIIAGVVHFAGYFWAMLSRPPRPVSPEFVAFRRKEQMRWLRAHLARSLRISKSSTS